MTPLTTPHPLPFAAARRRPALDRCCEVAVLVRTRSADRYVRGLAAAVVAVAVLGLAASTGPVPVPDPGPGPRTAHTPGTSVADGAPKRP
ncbi:hypothetical protein [Streptomyces sp. enrichment culture]|uniref:hypothetical protein n=1 Tax=Streptomyces sp. enrichment culture TaxID=1795815 RepID=UPI003F561142